MPEIISTHLPLEISLPLQSRWHENSFFLQLASAALGQANLEHRISAKDFLDYAEDLLCADGDEELVADVLDTFALRYRRQHSEELSSQQISILLKVSINLKQKTNTQL